MSHAVSVETVLARRGSLTLRLLEIDYENGGREVTNPLHYGPLYIGELEDLIDVDVVYDAAGLARAFPDHIDLLATIEAEFRRSAGGDIFAALDELWSNRAPGTSLTYEYARASETLRLREVESLVPIVNPSSPSEVFVIDRVRPVLGGGSDTRSFMFTRRDCLMVRYSTSLVLNSSTQSTEENLLRVGH